MSNVSLIHGRPISDLKVWQLQRERKANDLPILGLKEDLYERLKEYILANEATMPAGSGGGGVDWWELQDPVDVIGKLDAKFSELIESKNWADRKEALKVFYELLTNNPRLNQKQNYNGTVALLKKLLMEDPNMNVRSMAAKCLTGLARGLRTKFAPYASSVAAIIFERFKEKHRRLRDPLVECIVAVYATTNLAAIYEVTMAAMQKTNPQIKIQVDLFLYRVFKKFNATAAPKNELKALMPFLIKHMSDPHPGVRDAACSALGAIIAAIGRKPAGVLIDEIENGMLKTAKIRKAAATSTNVTQPPVQVSAAAIRTGQGKLRTHSRTAAMPHSSVSEEQQSEMREMQQMIGTLQAAMQQKIDALQARMKRLQRQPSSSEQTR
ncbi:CBR-ZYG-9 protein [Aphelenchoides avenae]|nr:CBR-ZYG-9 protein [Aphelenchus avenae]